MCLSPLQAGPGHGDVGGIVGIIQRWGALGLGGLRLLLPRGEVASCPKVAVAAAGLQGLSPLRSGGAGFVTRGDSGGWVDTWQTRCPSGTNPQLPGTPEPVWGLLAGTELH